MTEQQWLSFRGIASEREKRIRTRALLMDCAISEFACRGILRTSIDDIVAKAKVSRGTFYYHFAGKDEIVEAVGRAVAVGFVTIVDRAIRDVGTGPERVALATQIFIEMATTVPDWAWLVVEALANMGSFHKHISRGIRKDVLIGIRAGDFDAKPDGFLFESLLAVVGTAMRVRLERPDEPRVAARAAELVLVMLGTPLAEARRLPDAVVSVHGLRGSNSPDSVQHDLTEVMPLLLREILLEDESTVSVKG